MEASYSALITTRFDEPDVVHVLSLARDRDGLRVEQSRRCRGSKGQLKQELGQPPNVLLDCEPEGNVLWLRHERAFYVWLGAGRSDRSTRIKIRFRPRVRIESERIELFRVSGRMRTLTKNDIEAVASWGECDQQLGGVSLVPFGRRRIRIGCAFNSFYEDGWEGLEWTTALGSSLAQYLNVPWIDEVVRQ